MRFSEDVAEEDVAFDLLACAHFAAALAGCGYLQGGCCAAALGGFETEVGQVGEGCLRGHEGCHVPLGEPALQGHVAEVVDDCAVWEGVFDPGLGEARGWCEKRGELGG